MCLGADEALGKKFLAQEPPKSQPPSESPSPSPPKPSAPPAQPSTAPGPPAEALQQPQAQAAGQLASAQPGVSLPERRPQLWPSGGNPVAAIPQLPGVLLPVAIEPLYMLGVPCSSMHTVWSDGMLCCLQIQTGLSRGYLEIWTQNFAMPSPETQATVLGLLLYLCQAEAAVCTGAAARGLKLVYVGDQWKLH